MSRLEMSKTIIAEVGAEYDPEHNILKLDEPLEGVKGRVHLTVEAEKSTSDKASRPWAALKGCLPPETIDEIRGALAEASAPDANEP
jgi:hypothetical protein